MINAFQSAMVVLVSVLAPAMQVATCAIADSIRNIRPTIVHVLPRVRTQAPVQIFPAGIGRDQVSSFPSSAPAKGVCPP